MGVYPHNRCGFKGYRVSRSIDGKARQFYFSVAGLTDPEEIQAVAERALDLDEDLEWRQAVTKKREEKFRRKPYSRRDDVSCTGIRGINLQLRREELVTGEVSWYPTFSVHVAGGATSVAIKEGADGWLEAWQRAVVALLAIKGWPAEVGEWMVLACPPNPKMRLNALLRAYGVSLGSVAWARDFDVFEEDPQGGDEEDPQGGDEDLRWLPVVGYEGRYEVSEDGQVRAVRDGAARWLYLKPQKPKKGRALSVCLGPEGRQCRYSLGVVVANAFCGPRPDDHRVRYLNGDPGDCRASNLVWEPVPPHQRRKGPQIPMKAEHVVRMRKEYHGSMISQRELASRWSIKLSRYISRTTVSDILRGKRYREVGGPVGTRAPFCPWPRVAPASGPEDAPRIRRPSRYIRHRDTKPAPALGEARNWSELLGQVAEHLGISDKSAAEAGNVIRDSLVEALVAGDRIEIRGFGSFHVKDYKAYDGRNPKTGEVVRVKEKRLPVWRCGVPLRRLIEGGER